MSEILHRWRMRNIEKRKKKAKLRQIERDAAAEIKTSGKKTVSASKVIVAAILIICLQIVIYTEWMMYHFADMSALYVLVGIPAALAGTFWAYATKSAKENSQGGIVYETAMYELGMIEETENTGIAE